MQQGCCSGLMLFGQQGLLPITEKTFVTPSCAGRPDISSIGFGHPPGVSTAAYHGVSNRYSCCTVALPLSRWCSL